MKNPVYQHMSMPAEILRAKRENPTAYIGLGILEWHGLHNVAGLDGIKANALAEHFAVTFGGVVMPPLFWGDNREEICELVFSPDIIKEAVFDHTVPICEHMGYEKEKLVENARRNKADGGWTLWISLLVHMLFEAESFGYRNIVVIPGHYPLFNPLDTAIERYRREGGTSEVIVIKDTMFDPNGYSGDHAAKFETSLMLALCPDMVDLTRLDSDLSKPNIGVLGDDPRVYASAEYGWEIIRKFEDILKDKLCIK
jgi:creatinine amidohydrolase